MPGSRKKVLDKGTSLAADALILDLEDAVSPDEKDTARELVCEYAASKAFAPREVAIRINGLDTDWGEADLLAAAEAQPDAILIPKVSSAAMVRDIETRMKAAGASETTAIWAMIETPLGVLNAQEIAASTPRLTCFILGTNDLVADLNAQHTQDRVSVLPSLHHCLLAARAYGLSCVDGVHNAFKDTDGLGVVCKQARAMGFDGKTLIHPAQIDIANETFAPSEVEIEVAERYVPAFEEALGRGEAVAVVDGKIVENLHVASANRLIALASSIKTLAANL
jgi:citrate lyase beta subunit